jgi:hypothetical protein
MVPKTVVNLLKINFKDVKITLHSFLDQIFQLFQSLAIEEFSFPLIKIHLEKDSNVSTPIVEINILP